MDFFLQKNFIRGIVEKSFAWTIIDQSRANSQNMVIPRLPQKQEDEPENANRLKIFHI
jgi:hypothetical protein